jgi:hypothetical protein
VCLLLHLLLVSDSTGSLQSSSVFSVQILEHCGVDLIEVPVLSIASVFIVIDLTLA